MKRSVNNIYYKPITFSNIYRMWKVVKVTCKNKHGVYLFNRNKNTNIYNIGKILLEKRYIPHNYRLFIIFEPKERLVMSQDVSDKIVNHFVANFYLIPFLEKKLIDSNVATRSGKGTKYALYLINKYIHEIRMKYKNKEIYVLKIDISKYFYTINHEKLINMLKRDINDYDVINLIKNIIDETNKSYINETIKYLNKVNNTNIPLYQKGVGLSIGAMTSQFLAIYYLNDLDHFIKEKLHCKYYIRYMDDFVFFDVDKNRLKEIKKVVSYKLNDLKLKVNPKSCIYKLSNGISFVGYKFVINKNKLEILYNKKTKKRIDKKLNYLKNFDKVKYFKSYASYYGYFIYVKKIERDFKMKALEKYDSLKKEYEKKIVFIREGKFYYTFNDDAILMWNIFGYKWNKDMIAFGDSASVKVFDVLKSKGIAFVVDQNEFISVNGDAKIYSLELELAKIGYDKYLKKQKIYSLIDNLLLSDSDNYDKIISYLSNFN